MLGLVAGCKSPSYDQNGNIRDPAGAELSTNAPPTEAFDVNQKPYPGTDRSSDWRDQLIAPERPSH